MPGLAGSTAKAETGRASVVVQAASPAYSHSVYHPSLAYRYFESERAKMSANSRAPFCQLFPGPYFAQPHSEDWDSLLRESTKGP